MLIAAHLSPEILVTSADCRSFRCGSQHICHIFERSPGKLRPILRQLYAALAWPQRTRGTRESSIRLTWPGAVGTQCGETGKLRLPAGGHRGLCERRGGMQRVATAAAVIVRATTRRQ